MSCIFTDNYETTPKCSSDGVLLEVVSYWSLEDMGASTPGCGITDRGDSTRPVFFMLIPT